MALAIVVAWTTQDMRHDGKPFASDLGRRPGLVEVTVPHACMWLNRGGEDDVLKATAYALAQDPVARVYVYPTSERDPLGKAKADVLAGKAGR